MPTLARAQTALPTRRVAALVALFLAAALVLTGCQDADTNMKELRLAELVHDARANAKLRPLSHSAGLQDLARRHAEHLASTKRLVHTGDLGALVGTAVPNWTRVGENIAMGGDPESIHRSLMSSAGHRGNILGDYTVFAVGVARDEHGRYWVTQLFART